MQQVTQLDPIPGIQSRAVYLTPAEAKSMLERNRHNRKISEATIKKYIQEILADEWLLTPAGIGFDCKGCLVDGQHRLSAIARANRTVPVIITTGLPVASQEKVDRQRRRTLFDALYLSGFTTCRQEVEIATCLVRRSVKSDSGTVPSDVMVKQTIECHREHISAVLKVMKSANKKVRGLCQAAFLSAAVLYHEIDSERCEEFLEDVRKGTMLTQDHPAMRLRRFLMGETAVTTMPRGGANQSYIFKRAVFAMQAHLEGRMIAGLREADDFVIIKSKPKSPATHRKSMPASDITS